MTATRPAIPTLEWFRSDNSSEWHRLPASQIEPGDGVLFRGAIYMVETATSVTTVSHERVLLDITPAYDGDAEPTTITMAADHVADVLR